MNYLSSFRYLSYMNILTSKQKALKKYNYKSVLFSDWSLLLGRISGEFILNPMTLLLWVEGMSKIFLFWNDIFKQLASNCTERKSFKGDKMNIYTAFDKCYNSVTKCWFIHFLSILVTVVLLSSGQPSLRKSYGLKID